MPKPLTFITGNANKLREVKEILEQSGISVVSQNVDLPELQGDPTDISVEKCRLASEQVDGPVITEDTSLCYNALHGLPGPYIKWFLKSLGHEGLNRILAGYEDKSADAMCIFAFCPGKGQSVVPFVGKCPGRIVPARGPNTFGWDPIFQPDGFAETFAEMGAATKNRISHRSRSLGMLREYLQSHPELFA
ncbi:putative Inosine triphosphate pyrophosphatase [Paratrimastix pyriformis]|uniref:Inosine triphosphate pyrophosphatase n=1 Tax=Paratrimastix pyriformis TaxID=342808 RepID=A0ABQ8UFI1_9EUKA|nr:putative Inosine triphosphate pyrophosphatase [Paratrimastix pyriformis]